MRSSRLACDRLSISPALAFVVIGILVSEDFLGILALAPEAESVKLLAEVTLALVLFGDASSVDLQRLRRDAGPVIRLLVPGLLLTIVFGTIAGRRTLSGYHAWDLALLIGSSLAPTDAALGQPVITDQRVPARIRRILNVESGLNDGIATPFVLLALGLATAEATGSSGWISEALRDALIGVVAGIVVGAARWLAPGAGRSPGLDLVSVPPARGPRAGAGLVPGRRRSERQRIHRGVRGRARVRRRHPQTRRGRGGLHRGTGFVACHRRLDPLRDHGRRDADRRRPGPAAIVYAILSLTVVRMVPVALALIGCRFQPATVAFIGWFGPRGLASIVFMIIALEDLHDARQDTDVVVAAIGWTVLLSVVLHGLTAVPFARRYGAGSPRSRVRSQSTSFRVNRRHPGWAETAAPSLSSPYRGRRMLGISSAPHKDGT